MVTKTIKPAGGGDYSALQPWEDWADGESDPEQVAECYAGDCGRVTFAGWTATLTESAHPRITVAAGERHDGTYGSVGSAARIVSSTNFQYALGVNSLKYLTVENIAVLVSANNARSVQIHKDSAALGGGFTFDAVLFSTNMGMASDRWAIEIGSDSFSSGAIFVNVYNCATVRSAVHKPLGLLAGELKNAGHTRDIEMINNSAPLSSSTGVTNTVQLNATHASSTFNVTAINNAFYGASSACFYATGSGSLNYNASHNASSDATADDWGATGAQLNRSVSDDFAAPNTSIELLDTGVLVDGGTDTSAYGVTVDMLGTARGATYDIGAYEIAELAAAGLDERHYPRGLCRGLLRGMA